SLATFRSFGGMKQESGHRIPSLIPDPSSRKVAFIPHPCKRSPIPHFSKKSLPISLSDFQPLPGRLFQKKIRNSCHTCPPRQKKNARTESSAVVGRDRSRPER